MKKKKITSSFIMALKPDLPEVRLIGEKKIMDFK